MWYPMCGPIGRKWCVTGTPRWSSHSRRLAYTPINIAWYSGLLFRCLCGPLVQLCNHKINPFLSRVSLKKCHLNQWYFESYGKKHTFNRNDRDLWVEFWFTILLSSLILIYINNMFYCFRLVYDKKTRTTHNSPGVDIVIPSFGNTSALEFLDPSKLSPSKYSLVLSKICIR